MKFDTTLPDGQKLQVIKSFWTGKTSLSMGKTKLVFKSYSQKEPFKITLKDGSEHKLLVKHDWLDPMPLLLLDDNDLFASKRLKKWEKSLVCIPALLILNLGAIPAIIGISLVYLNFFIARNEDLNIAVKWTLIGVTPVVGEIVIVAVSLMIMGNGNLNDAAFQKQRAAQESAQKLKQEPGWNASTRPASRVEAELEGR